MSLEHVVNNLLARIVALEHEVAALQNRVVSLPTNVIFEGVTDEQISKGSNGTVSIYTLNAAGSFVDTGEDVEFYFPAGRGADIPISKWVIGISHNGRVVPIASEC